MKNLVIFILLLFVSNSVISQSLSDTITIYKNKKFYQNLHQLSQAELRTIMKGNEEADSYIIKAKGISNASTAVYITGAGIALGGLFIDDISTAIVVGVGLGIELIGVIISSGVKKNTVKAVNIYNDDLKKMYKPVSYRLKAGVTSNGMALILTF